MTSKEGPAMRAALGRQRPLFLGGIRRQKIHERRRQAVVRLKTQLLQPSANGAHLIGLGSRLDDRGDECCELRSGPALLLRQLDMDEVKAVERMRLVFDA